MVVDGSVDGSGTVVVVTGACVVVVSGGASVVAVVVWTGGEVGVGADVPAVVRGAVVTTPAGCVVTGPPAMVVPGAVVEGDEVEVDVALEVVVARKVVVGCAVVDDDWLATCCLAEVSAPVATSKSMATRATAART